MAHVIQQVASSVVQCVTPPCGGGGSASTLLDDLVAWWSLNEAAGATRVDSSSSGYDLVDGTILDVVQVAGKVGNASSTTHQTSASLVISNAASPGLHPQDVDYTIAGWFNLSSGGNNAGIFSCYDLLDGQVLWIPPGETDIWYTVSGTHLATFTPSTSTWYHFVCSHDATGNTIDVRINDTTDYTTAHTTGIASPAEPFILHNYTTSGAFSIGGALDEVGAWNRILTPAEITELYNSGDGIGYPG